VVCYVSSSQARGAVGLNQRGELSSSSPIVVFLDVKNRLTLSGGPLSLLSPHDRDTQLVVRPSVKLPNSWI
jgi:hypothetical protein